MGEIYGRDQAIGTNTGNIDDDEEKVCEDDNISINFESESNNVNLGSELNNEPIMDDLNNDMSYTPQTNATSHHHVNYALSSSTNKSKKIKSKDKLFDHMCSKIEIMADSVAAMVPKIDGLITALSSDEEIADLQGKLYVEMSKIGGLADEEIYCATSILALKHDLLRVFFTLHDHLKKRYVIQIVRRGV